MWFANDPLQTPWHRFLDEVAEVGYDWLELGPYGYLPSDPSRLTDELAGRGLKVAGGTVHGFSGLHRPGDWPDIVRITRQVSALTEAVGGRHVVQDRHHALERPALEAYRACLRRLLED